MKYVPPVDYLDRSYDISGAFHITRFHLHLLCGEVSAGGLGEADVGSEFAGMH